MKLAMGAVCVLLSIAAQASLPEVKIVGGKPVTAKERPWVVKIHRNGRGHCTGSLISKQWMITAAHCFIGGRAPYTDFALGGGGDGKYVNLVRLPNIDQVFIHPNYRRSNETTAQDLALVKLKEPVKQDENLAPIPLKNLNGTRMSETNASITAWGMTDGRGSLPTQLQSITLPVKRIKDVPDLPPYFDRHPEFIKPGVLVMIKQGVTTCRGDSGAGWTMEIDGTPYLIGVHSAGDLCESIAIGAELSHSLLWIKTRMLLSGL